MWLRIRSLQSPIGAEFFRLKLNQTPVFSRAGVEICQFHSHGENCETGDGNCETGDGNRETGDGNCETDDGHCETGDIHD